MPISARASTAPVAAGSLPVYADLAELLRAERPVEPVYCIYPQIYRQTAAEFVAGFPGRVLYAVKANDHPDVLRALHAGGVRHFDCASLPEVELVQRECPGAECYFMVPTRLRGAARAAFERHGVRHFMVDHANGIDLLANEIDLGAVVVFVRMAVTHEAAMMELSSKFGAPPADVPAILDALARRGAEPALAFNVGSSVIHPDAYLHALDICRGVLHNTASPIRLLDIGGGFPRPYPDFPVPPLRDYFRAIGEAASRLPLAPGSELMCEPGRALAAPGVSALTEVLLRKEDRLYLNDGMYGVFWEIRFKGHKRFPARVWRDGRPHSAPLFSFQLYGPTCDSFDVLPGRVDLPQDIRPGDHVEFGNIGAYSLSGRTHFNGYHSDRIVHLVGDGAIPPR